MAKYNLIGRQYEVGELEHLYASGKSEFVAIYGRRRVGKSYLIDQVYGKKMSFSTVGIYFKKDERPSFRYRQEQLAHFYESLLQFGIPADSPMPTCWREAFRLLRQLLEGKKIQLSDLGDFSVSLVSKGAKTADKFSASNITDVKVT